MVFFWVPFWLYRDFHGKQCFGNLKDIVAVLWEYEDPGRYVPMIPILLFLGSGEGRQACGFSKIMRTTSGVPTIRTLVFWGPCPVCRETVADVS